MRTRRRMAAAALCLALLAAGCAARGLQDVALSVGEVVLQLDATERELYRAGLYGPERHLALGDLVLRTLHAARALTAAARGTAGHVEATAALRAALADLDAAAGDLPPLRILTARIRALIGGA